MCYSFILSSLLSWISKVIKTICSKSVHSIGSFKWILNYDYDDDDYHSDDQCPHEFTSYDDNLTTKKNYWTVLIMFSDQEEKEIKIKW